MRNMCLLGIVISLASPTVWAQTPPAPLAPKDVFVAQLLQKMTEDEKIGQLRLISIGPECPAK